MESILEQLATHIPDLVIRKPQSDQLPQTVHSYGVIVFADISGFTALCEKYTSGVKSKENAADQLTTVLNSYLSKIVAVVLEAGGDVLKFAGDALLAFWSCSRFSVSGMLNHVLSTCLRIQSNYDNFRTQDGDVLRMKIGLSNGRVDLHYIGNKSVRLFDVTGQAIEDSNTAQHLAKSGAVVISKLALEYTNKEKCVTVLVGSGFAQVRELKDGLSSFVVPTSPLASPKARRKTVNVDERLSQPLTGKKKPQNTPSAKIWSAVGKKDKNKDIRKESSTSLKSCRTVLTYRTKIRDIIPLLPPEAQHDFRTYILPTVLHKIDHGYDVSWFSELREVSVLFINLNPATRLGASQTLTLLQNSFGMIYPALNKYNATLNKVFMFDKGCTFLCIFGLPHTRHEDSTCSALRAARDIFNALRKLRLNGGNYSIGVTTGVAFCGVVGHPQRHEYTVIGQKVNLGARMMMKFPGSITCDETTKTKSALSSDQFTLVPLTPLKGITNPENIYTFSPEHVETMEFYNWDVHKATDADDLIGRHEEMQIFLDELVHVTEHTNRSTGVIIISGVGGIGKTKLLRAMKAKAAMMNFRVVSGIGGLIEESTPFFTVKTLVAKLLHIDNSKSVHEREQLLLQHVTDPDMRELLPLLNDLLVLKLPQTPTTIELHSKERTKALHKLLFSLVHQEALMKPCVFGIDDAHWIDPDSWNFLIDLEREVNAILILTTRPLERMIKKPPALIEILNHPHTKVIHLQGLNSEEMVELTCRQLGVDTIPSELKDIIHKRSHGVPLWCEELIQTMLELNYLRIVDMIDEGGTERRQLTLTNASRIQAGIGEALFARDIPIPDSVTGMVLARIDHMSASDQMILKCAAVIGKVFTKTMLQAIVPNCNAMTFHNSLLTLAEAGIIECAVLSRARSIMSEQDEADDNASIPRLPSSLVCPCLDIVDFGSQRMHRYHSFHHAPVDNCETLQFIHNYVQETAYNLCTEAQRKTLHTSAAHFLESYAHKCKNCGGGDFIGGKTLVKKKSKCVTRRVYVGAGGTRLQSRGYPTVTPSTTTPQVSHIIEGEDGAPAQSPQGNGKSIAKGSETGQEKAGLPAGSQAGPRKNSEAVRKSSDPVRRVSSARRRSSDAGLTGLQASLRAGLRRNSDIGPRGSVAGWRANRRGSEPSPRISKAGGGGLAVNVAGLKSPEASPKKVTISPKHTVHDKRKLSTTSMIQSSNSYMIEMESCHCDEVLAKVYPQLVRHWRAAGDMHSTMVYLIEEASAALATFNNMEALSLLQEAKEIYEGLDKAVVSSQELGRMQSLRGQTLYQMGQVDESMSYFYQALRLLNSSLPRTLLGGAIALFYHSMKQFTKWNCPCNSVPQLNKDEPFLDRARCLAHIGHAYHLQQKNTMSLMTIMKRLNEADHAQEYHVYEVMEAFAAIIEHCQKRNFGKTANRYFNRAMTYCDDIELAIEDVHAYTHLLFVGLSLKLYQGDLSDALTIGTATYNAIKRKHDPSMEFCTLPLLFFTNMACYNRAIATEILKEFSEVASESDDLRAQALYDCCHFDGLLEFGIDWQDENRIVTRARLCYTDQDIYYYDEVERYYLISCLALWHARKDNNCDRYYASAKELQPRQISSYLGVKAHSRFTEVCLLLLLKVQNREYIKAVRKALKKFRLALPNFAVFLPRYLHFQAYYSLIRGRPHQSRDFLRRAFMEADRNGCIYDAEWCLSSKKAWFPNDPSLKAIEAENGEDDEDSVFMFVFQPPQTNKK